MGSLTFQGGWTLEVLDAGLTRDIVTSDEFVIATAGSIANPLGVRFSLPTGWTGGILEHRGNDLVLFGVQSAIPTVIIPEPVAVAVWALLGLCLAAVSARRQRR